MSTAYLNDTIKITVVFRTAGVGDEIPPPEDPDTVSVSVTQTNTDPPIVTPYTPVHGVGVGEYYIIWNPPSTGNFTVDFEGTFSDSTSDSVIELFTVEEAPSEVLTAGLLEDYTLNLAAGLDPLYLDPAELTPIFPEATLLDIAEFINLFSLEVKEMFDLQPTDTPDFKMLEYIKAATACSLSKIFASESDSELSYRLGDLSVTNRNFPKASVNRGNATTWCELAAAYRKEMLYGNVGMRRTVKSGARHNPIPKRKLKKF